MDQKLIDRINAIQNDYKNALEELQQKFNEASRNYEECAAQAVEEYGKTNAKKYAEAKNESEILRHESELYKSKLEELRKNPVITEAEYKKFVKEINKNCEAEVSEICAHIVESIRSAAEEAYKANDIIRDAEEALKIVQRDLYKQDFYFKPAVGDPVYMAGREEHIKTFNPVYFIQECIGDEKRNAPLYDKILKLANK